MSHPDDEFHPPTNDDPYWAETCWFAFNEPSRRLSGHLYPFFQANMKTTAAGAYVWDERGSQPWNCRYMKNFWHLPFPESPLSDLKLENGLRYHCVEPRSVYEISYEDPDGGDLRIDLTFSATAEPHYLGDHHLDQPGRYTGTVVLDGETIEINSYGFRDRSWGPRTQFGRGRATGYDFGTTADDHGFHMISFDSGDGYRGMHGHILRDGKWAKLTSGQRVVLRRDPATGAPTQVAVDLQDELGRTLHAEGEALNRIGVHLNPNLFTWMCLHRWSFDGVEAFGEDHDNWSAPEATRHFRALLFPDGDRDGFS
ncbi:MAG: hypothetical protein J2P57_13005 [Acidimicrobiaceae bacterium]|nr:hypothetical protein [Acidimicrobiaceae bacterium]